MDIMHIFRGRSIEERLLWGVVAGATGTVALNITTYLDMVVRGRPSSGVPAKVAGSMADVAGIQALSLDNEEEAAKNRRSGAGALLGYVSGLGVSMTYAALISGKGLSHPTRTGVILGLGAMAMSDIPIIVTGSGDPRTWSRAAWLSDIIPHLAYGLAAAAVLKRR
jgi:hypothetical protein